MTAMAAASIDGTHDPAAQSWVASANTGRGDFPLQNLPHGVFRVAGEGDAGWRGGVAIGDQVLDLRAAREAGVFSETARAAAAAASLPQLNELMALGPAAWQALRAELFRLLRDGATEAPRLRDCLVPQDAIEHTLPTRIGDYTDFFTSYHHMVNAGRVFKPDAPPLPNFAWLPLAYHGRASSVAVSGTPVWRPHGQLAGLDGAPPRHAPIAKLDYELELGFYVGAGNARGRPIPVAEAEDHVFGLCLLNDWSARDVQAWESVPLGPFLAKNFLTSVSPWVVTLQALAPYRIALPRDTSGEGTVANLRLPPGAQAGIDLRLQATIRTRDSGTREMPLSSSNFRHCHWSIAQMVAHHTEGGCTLRPGDLIGTGTQSGPEEGEQGCLLELSRGGREPLLLANGERRSYLEDGDTVTLQAWAERKGSARIGFGVCRGTVG